MLETRHATKMIDVKCVQLAARVSKVIYFFFASAVELLTM